MTSNSEENNQPADKAFLSPKPEKTPTEPAKPVQTAGPGQPATPGQPARTKQTIEPVAPVEPVAPPTPVDPIQPARPFRERVIVSLRRRPGLVALVLLPIAVAAIYLFILASDRFVSEAKLTVKRGSSEGVSLTLGLLGGGAVTEREDSLYLKEYILSMDMLTALEKGINISALYRDPNADYFSILDSDATREEFLEYYQNHVHIHLDDTSSIITLRVQAFSPEAAKRISDAMIRESDRFVNVLSNRVANEQLGFVAQELDEARHALQLTKTKLSSFQDKHAVLDPAEQAQATANLVGTMEAELAQLETERKGLLAYLKDTAPQLTTLDAKMDSIKAQIASERRKVVGTSRGGQQLNKLALDFQGLQVETGFALDRYKAALQVMEKTRVEASKRVKSLVVITSPQLAEEAEEPRRLYLFVLTLLALAMSYGIVRMTVATIKDHID